MEAIDRVRMRLPFPLLGLDCDNGSEFLNAHLVRYCTEQQITFTRSRPYNKNDQAHVEQKNGSVVRRWIGYDRYEGDRGTRMMNDFYELLRLYNNFFPWTARAGSPASSSSAGFAMSTTRHGMGPR